MNRIYMGRKSGLKLSIFTCLDFTHPKPNPKKKLFLPKTKAPNVSKLTQQRSQQVKAFSKKHKPHILTHSSKSKSQHEEQLSRNITQILTHLTKSKAPIPINLCHKKNPQMLRKWTSTQIKISTRILFSQQSNPTPWVFPHEIQRSPWFLITSTSSPKSLLCMCYNKQENLHWIKIQKE